MSTFIALFTVPGVRRDLQAGKVATNDSAVRPATLLSRLPRSWRALGLLPGAGFAPVLVPVACAVAVVLGLSELAFGWLILFKVCCTGTVAFAVTRWLILRQLQPPR